jgi:protein SCO1
MKCHAQNFDPNFVMLTGSLDILKKLQKSYQVYSEKTATQSKDVYELDHSSLIYLMAPDGQFLQMFPHTTPADRIAQILTQHLVQEKKIL